MTFPTTYTPEPKRPWGSAQPGAVNLLNFAIGTFDLAAYGDELASLGVYNPRDIYGNQWPGWRGKGSQHARGAAGDVRVPVLRPGGHVEGWRLAHWLVTHHVRLGVQEVIFAGMRWTNQTRRWVPYYGPSDHFDHVHFALNAEAAAGLTTEMILAVWHESREEEIDMGAKEDIEATIHAVGNSLGKRLDALDLKLAVVDRLASDIHPDAEEARRDVKAALEELRDLKITGGQVDVGELADAVVDEIHDRTEK